MKKGWVLATQECRILRFVYDYPLIEFPVLIVPGVLSLLST